MPLIPLLTPIEVTAQESRGMKLHLMQRKLIINKITSVKAITDNNCVKKLLRCVCGAEEDIS